MKKKKKKNLISNRGHSFFSLFSSFFLFFRKESTHLFESLRKGDHRSSEPVEFLSAIRAVLLEKQDIDWRQDDVGKRRDKVLR